MILAQTIGPGGDKISDGLEAEIECEDRDCVSK